ncbi:hypothetical protein C8R45DRAFT_1164901 [Mycena sanguinolenta]|nr:hypothetical protein C8R45DRAFT_1164901 [Mycena sanguinolenta]
MNERVHPTPPPPSETRRKRHEPKNRGRRLDSTRIRARARPRTVEKKAKKRRKTRTSIRARLIQRISRHDTPWARSSRQVRVYLRLEICYALNTKPQGLWCSTKDANGTKAQGHARREPQPRAKDGQKKAKDKDATQRTCPLLCLYSHSHPHSLECPWVKETRRAIHPRNRILSPSPSHAQSRKTSRAGRTRKYKDKRTQNIRATKTRRGRNKAPTTTRAGPAGRPSTRRVCPSSNGRRVGGVDICYALNTTPRRDGGKEATQPGTKDQARRQASAEHNANQIQCKMRQAQ